jgi:hypothetical protein
MRAIMLVDISAVILVDVCVFATLGTRLGLMARRPALSGIEPKRIENRKTHRDRLLRPTMAAALPYVTPILHHRVLLAQRQQM